jgi:hypothetical protein
MNEWMTAKIKINGGSDSSVIRALDSYMESPGPNPVKIILA